MRRRTFTNQQRQGCFAEQGGIPLGIIFLLLVVTVLATVGVIGWQRLAGRFLERNPPVITIVEAPRGIGVAPAAIKIRLTDDGAGLDEVVVRTQQKRQEREILRRSLEGQPRGEIAIDFPGDKSGFEEGAAAVVIRAFDRSFWSNHSETTIALKVDYRRPKVEVISSQHNAREGGSQLVFYKAYDDNLALSGVKVGSQAFVGFPARGIDAEFEDPNLFVAIYGIAAGQKADSSAVRVFAEDEVGNAASAGFYNKIQPRGAQRDEIALSDDFLRNRIAPLADANLEKIEAAAAAAGEALAFTGEKGSIERLIEKFTLVNSNLRRINERELVQFMKSPRFERYWNGPFLLPGGGFGARFGETIVYRRDGAVIGQVRAGGYEISPPKGAEDVTALNDGIVLFAEDLGVYGLTVGIDHGLGLTTIYAGLGAIAVKKGASVTQGEKIGAIGRTGLSRGPGYLLQMRLSGVPVDPLEWWDRGWYESHVNGKINDAKQVLGIRVLKPLRKAF